MFTEIKIKKKEVGKDYFLNDFKKQYLSEFQPTDLEGGLQANKNYIFRYIYDYLRNCLSGQSIVSDRFIFFNSPRRSGASMAAALLAHHVARDYGKNVAIFISNKHMYNRMEEYLNGLYYYDTNDRIDIFTYDELRARVNRINSIEYSLVIMDDIFKQSNSKYIIDHIVAATASRRISPHYVLLGPGNPHVSSYNEVFHSDNQRGRESISRDTYCDVENRMALPLESSPEENEYRERLRNILQREEKFVGETISSNGVELGIICSKTYNSGMDGYNTIEYDVRVPGGNPLSVRVFAI